MNLTQLTFLTGQIKIFNEVMRVELKKVHFLK
jgi:hypothetical protein